MYLAIAILQKCKGKVRIVYGICLQSLRPCVTYACNIWVNILDLDHTYLTYASRYWQKLPFDVSIKPFILPFNQTQCHNYE